MNLEPGDLVLVKADAFKGKRKIKDRWEEDTWEVVHQIAKDIPSYQVRDHVEGLASSTRTDFFSLHQKLAFPCVQASVMHETGVPALSHASPPPQEVN